MRRKSVRQAVLLVCAAFFCFTRNASSQPLTISCSTLAGPTQAGVSYAATCSAAGGTPLYTWSIASGGALPAGLTLTPSADTLTAAISGSPTVSGPYNYTVQVADSEMPPMTAQQNYSGTIAPNITAISPSSATAGAPAFTLTVNGAGFGADSAVFFNSTQLTPVTVVNSNQVTAPVPASLIATPGTVSVTLTSGGATSNAVTFTINPPPVITSISPTSIAAGAAAFTLTVNGSGFGADSVVNFNGTALTPTSITPSQVTATGPANLITTSGTVPVTITTGGVTSNSANFTINPTVTSISPASATAGGPAFTLTVNGTGFTSGAKIQWNGSALATTFVSSTQLTAPVLQNLIASAGTAQVTVLSSGLTSNAETFTILPPPAISSISPATVTAGGAAFTLTVNGSGFASGAVVQWNGAALTTNFLSSSQVTASVPASDISSPGSAQITVKSGGVTSNSETLTIVPGPALGFINPNTITAGSATFTLVATGSGFASGASVLWNGAPLATTFENSGLLDAVVPARLVASAGTAQVSVSSGGVTSNSLPFTIVAAPTISSLSPNTITAGSPAFTMTVTGSGFASGASVEWNGTPLGTVLVSSTQLTASVPASDVASPGTARVTVISGGVTSNSVNFTIVVGPAVTLLTPATITAGSGPFTLTVNGTGFASGAVVEWNTTALTTTFVSATQVTAPVSASLIATPGTVSVSVISGGVTSNGLSFTIVAGPTLTSLSPASITGGSGAGLGPAGSCPANVFPVGTLTLNGSGFVSGAAAEWNGQSLVTTFVNSTQLTACVPSGFIQGYGAATITVSSQGTTSNPQQISLTVPAITLTGLQSTPAPTQQLQVGVKLTSATPTALQGTLKLSFSTTAPGVPAGYMDPALQFSSGGTSATFTMAKGSSSVSVGAIQQGTVEGTITVTLTSLTANGANVLPSSQVVGTVAIPPLPPVITPGSVQITNLTSSGFDVVLTGYSVTREMTTANFSFTAAAGTQFTGATTFSVDVSSAFSGWYANASSQPEGSLFLLTVPFTISGPTSVLGSVSVTLTNSVGTSAPVSASP